MSHKGDGLSTVARRTKSVELPNGRSIELSQLTIKDLVALREQACDEYKRSILRTYTQNQDMLAGIDLKDKVAEIAQITPDDMPMKKAWTAMRNEEGEIIKSDRDKYFHKQANSWVNRGDPVPALGDVPYEAWWSSATPMGRLHTLWYSMRHCAGQQNITLDEVVEIFTDEALVASLADDIGSLSAQRLGKEQPAAQTAS